MNLSEFLDLMEDLEYNIQKETGVTQVEVPVMMKNGKPVHVKVAKDKETGKIKAIILA